MKINIKLSLFIVKELIKAFREYSVKTGKSLNHLVADFFKKIKKVKLSEKNKFTPTVRSLKGILKDTQVSEADYQNHLKDKYL